MLTEGKVRAIAAQVAAAIAGNVKPNVSDAQIESAVEVVIRRMQENGALVPGGGASDEQIAKEVAKYLAENPIKGADGKDGANGMSTYEIWLAKGNTGTEDDFLASLKGEPGTQGEKGDNGTNGTDGKDGKDGKDGYTPVKGTDYFTPNEIAAIKAEIKQGVLEEMGVIVTGTVDSDKDIILSGNGIDPREYTFKFIMDDGSLVTIGSPVPAFAVTTVLTNCSSDNTNNLVPSGGNYSAVITPDDGYGVSSITVTMGGTDITATAVSGNTITIASVTGDVVITAVANEEASGATYTNQIPLAKDGSGNPYNSGKGYKSGYRLSGSSGNESAQTGTEVTGFIPVKYNDVVYVKGIVDDGSHYIALYTADHTFNACASIANAFLNVDSLDGGVQNFAIKTAHFTSDTTEELQQVAWMRICATEITDNSIITVNEPIE